MSEMEKLISSGGVDVLPVSETHGSRKAGGRAVDGAIGGGVGCGRGVPLLMRSWMEGVTSFSLALIFQTELNLASRLQVAKASSYKQ